MGRLGIILSLLLMAAGIAPARAETASALCISFYEANVFERVAFAAFAQATCGHYDRSLVITNRPKAAASALSARRREKIRQFIRDSKTFDLFIYGHTNHASTWFRIEFATEFGNRLRLVYNSGCEDGTSDDGEAWLLSARAFVGHPGNNYGGKYTPAFTRRWFRGEPLALVVGSTNHLLRKSKYFADGNDPYGYLYGDGSLRFSARKASHHP